MSDNDRRALEGEAEVLMGADALANDPVTACIDATANILHFARSLGVEPQQLLQQAERTYLGDLEDGPEAAQTRTEEQAFSEEFVPRPEALLLVKSRMVDLV